MALAVHLIIELEVHPVGSTGSMSSIRLWRNAGPTRTGPIIRPNLMEA